METQNRIDKAKSRQEIIIQGRLEGLSYTELGKQMGCSRQRIHQIIAPPKETRNAVVLRYQGKCCQCGQVVNGSGHVHHVSCEGEDYNDLANLQLLCRACHRKAHKLPATFCPVCGQEKLREQSHCSRRCFRASRQATVNCTYCGKTIIRRKQEITRRYDRPWEHIKHGFNTSDRYFCNRQCMGKWLGRHRWAKPPQGHAPPQVS